MQDIKVNVLGAEWTIRFGKESEYPNLKDVDGYTDSSVREIVVDDFSRAQEDPFSKKDVAQHQKQAIRHELVHAFLEESGLGGNGCAVEHWEYNEEMVDWFAIQSPKIFKVFKELELL